MWDAGLRELLPEQLEFELERLGVLPLRVGSLPLPLKALPLGTLGDSRKLQATF